MALTLEQHQNLQPAILAVQRLALQFAELGEIRVAKDPLAAATKASRLRPAKEAPAAPESAPVAPVKNIAKEKAA